MSYLLDSDWLIDVLRGSDPAIATLTLLGDEGLFVSVISFGELLEGAYRSPDPERHRASLRHLFSGFTLLPVDEPIANEFARLRSRLRRQGLLIADLDLLIAATAIQFDLTLITRNVRHFSRLPELRLYSTT